MKKIIENQLVMLFFSCLLLFSSASFAIDWFGNDDVIWKIGLNQYIKYAAQDSSKFGKNDHPVKLDEKELGYALKALVYEEKGLFSATEELKIVFTSLQVKVLSDSLTKGLKNAKPEQDVIFVLETATKKMLGLKEKTSLAARAFYKDGKVNIIMGDYEYFRSEAFEKTYDPGGQSAVPYNFNFGKRTKPSKAFLDTHINVAGVNNKRIDNDLRQDWILIDVKAASAGYIAKKTSSKENATTTKIDRKLQEESAKLAKQRREMRAEMARMRKQVKDIENNNEPVSVRSIEERMAMLDQLLGKKLITQEEYDSKRQDILNDI
jgi:hypothetical protein